VTGLALGAAFAVTTVLAFAPAPLAHAADCFDGEGNTVPCPTDAPTTPPPTQAPPTLPPVTPPQTSPPPATVTPQTVAPGTTPTTRRRTTTTQDVTPATPAPSTVSSTPPSTKPKKVTTTTRATTTTSAPDRIVTAPIGNVGPPSNDGGSSPAKTIAAILGVALLLVLGILGPELRSRFGRHRPSAV
jgi:hypothetical protein